MPSLNYGLSSYERSRGGLPGLPVGNMFAEEAPTEEKGIMLQSRPGLDDREADMGTGPVEALFQRDLVLDSALFGISGGALYRATTLLGTLDGSGPGSLAGYETFLFANAGASLWGWDGAALAAISFPDSANVSKCIIAASRVIAIRADTGKFYWSDPLEEDIDALDFATAENQPDRLLDLLFIDDTLILFGAETVEFWANTPDGTLPFSAIEQRVIERGIKATGCAVGIASTFAWVTSDNQVCLGDENNILTNPGLEEKIEASTDCRLFTFFIGGLEFLCLRLDDETQVWNLRSGKWSEFQSRDAVTGEPINWIPQCYAGGVFGSSIDGATMQWGTGHEDLAGPMERQFRAGFPLNSGGVYIDNIRLRCNVGQTPYLEGDYDDPVVEMRLSWDAGQTWDAWESVSLGVQGDYTAQPLWAALGLASQPGLLAEFRVTDPIDFRVSDALVNEPFGGR